ncbi:MAG: hypothetical protein AAGG01_23555 [Planctomycetota bacterium]
MRITGGLGSKHPEFTDGGPLRSGEPRFSMVPIAPGLLEVRMVGDGWKPSATTLEIRPGERALWTPRMELH